jgi:mono/diheme cytochrome c family protein
MRQTAQDSIKWAAPASANKLINSYEANDENIEIGKSIYRKHCRSCHGKTGDGQGVGAADLLTTVTNFTNPALVEQTDGSMFWKISEGRNDILIGNPKNILI